MRFYGFTLVSISRRSPKKSLFSFIILVNLEGKKYQLQNIELIKRWTLLNEMLSLMVRQRWNGFADKELWSDLKKMIIAGDVYGVKSNEVVICGKNGLFCFENWQLYEQNQLVLSWKQSYRKIEFNRSRKTIQK